MSDDRAVRRERRRVGAAALLAALASGAQAPPHLSAQVLAPQPAPLSVALQPYVGEYGWAGKALYVYERDGRLLVRVAETVAYPLTATGPDTFALPATGLYGGERIVFLRAGADRAAAAQLGSADFPRRAVGPEDGGQLRVAPLRPVAELLAEAQTAVPPAQPDTLLAPDLVDVAALDSTIRLDVRYATTNNFLGSRFYSTSRVFLQRPAAEAVVRASRWLRQHGYGLLIHDGYRPWFVTKVFWDATPPPLRWLVADPANGSRHNRGCAVDLELYDLATDAPVDMGGTYDEATPRSFPDYPVTSSLAAWHRELLRRALAQEGFVRTPQEWWHFDHRDWRRYPILNVTFEALGR